LQILKEYIIGLWRARLLSDPNAPNAINCSLLSFQQRNKLISKRKKELETEITFFKKNKKHMKYYDFNKRGLPIGSGSELELCKRAICINYQS